MDGRASDRLRPPSFRAARPLHIEQLRPDNPLAQAPHLAAPFSLTNLAGIAVLNAEVTRQASMIAYINDFALMMATTIGSILLLLLRPPALRPAPKPAIATGGILRPGAAD